MALHILGDPHFSALQPWRLPLGDAFLSWFETYEASPNDDLLCLGDYTDDAVNPGKVVKQVKQFADIAKSKFNQVYFMVGNHDLKLYKNKPQLSFEFVEREGVIILKDPAQVLDIQGLHILSLPHYNYRTDLPPMWDYYGNLPQEIRDDSFDLVCGHFSDNSVQLFDHTIDISYLHAKHIALGHQHIRISSHYTGSLFPCKISENDSPKPRAVWVYEKTGHLVTKKEVVMPRFGEYRAVEYPKPLPKVNANVTIYTILGCETEKIARDFYGDIYIRGVASNFVKKNNNIVVSDDAFVIGDPIEIFTEWTKVAKTPVSRSVAGLVKKILAPQIPVAALPAPLEKETIAANTN